jgi:acyl-coenzyme A thioesterase PaaI-like protein
MDMTALARALLDPIPANRTAGITVLRAADGAAQVAMAANAELANVIGSLHSSGLMALADAAGLAAVIAACDSPDEMRGVVPLGARAAVEFRAPARGRLTGSCQLDDAACRALRPVLAGQHDRARVSTVADITDEASVLVCRGTFEWSIRRSPPAGAAD